MNWDEVVGLDTAKKAIKEAIIYPVQRPDLFPLGWPRGIMLFGPPGCGKTLLAAAAATEIDATFFSIDAASIMSKWLGEAEQNVAKLFGSARKSSNEGKPAIVFVDEVDSLMGQHSNEVGGEIRVRNQFLKEMDGIVDKGKNLHVYVIGATNKPWDLRLGFHPKIPKKNSCSPSRSPHTLKHAQTLHANLSVAQDVDLTRTSTAFRRLLRKRHPRCLPISPTQPHRRILRIRQSKRQRSQTTRLNHGRLQTNIRRTETKRLSRHAGHVQQMV